MKNKGLYSGGSGQSVEDAIVINTDISSIGISAEYAHIEGILGPQDVAWKLIMQSLISLQSGKRYDLLEIELNDGQKLLFYFDITAFHRR